MNKFIAVLALLWGFSASAGVGTPNKVIVPGGDGDLYLEFPDGSVDPTPPYVALALSINQAFVTAGWDSIACGTTGTDKTLNLRPLVTAGTNAATAAISINQGSGDNFVTEGATAPGTGNNITFECAHPTESHSGTFTITVDDSNVCTPPSCSSDISNSKSWGTIGTGTPDPGDPDHSHVSLSQGWETGSILDRSTLTGGISLDATRLQYLGARATFTIDSVCSGSTPLIHWTGADPNFTNPSSQSQTNNGGFTFPSSTPGIASLANRMMRCSAINTGANTCTPKEDGNNDQSSDGNEILGDNNVTNICPGTLSGSVVVTLWDNQATSGASSLGTSSTEDIHVVSSVTPPANLNGTALAFSPREGTKFLTASIYKIKDYSAIGGQGNPSKNKPRMQFLNTIDGVIDVPNNVDSCLGVSIAVPSNYDSNDRGGVNETENQWVRVAETDAQDETAVNLGVAGDSSGTDHLYLTLDYGTHKTPAATAAHDIDLGPVTGSGNLVNMVGKWNDFVMYYRFVNSSSGFLKLWHRTADRDGVSNITAWKLLYSRVGQPTGHTYAGKFRPSARYYKHGWTDNTGTTPSLVIWHGWDAFYNTKFVADGGTCHNVTIDGSDPTL